MRNVAVDFASYFGNDAKTDSVIRNYVKTGHVVQPYIDFRRGFIDVDCQLNEHWKSDVMPGWNVDWTVNAVASRSDATSASCDLWVDHKVLVNQRDTFANFFHDSEDFVNAFLAMAILEWQSADTQMFVTDLYPRGAFWSIWSKAFSSGQLPAINAWDIRHMYGKTMKGKRVCFKELAISIYGPAAPITVASWNTPCHKTALVRAYSDFIIRGLNLQDYSHYLSHKNKPNDKIVITYMARRSQRDWPEKQFCDDENSFFKCDYWKNKGKRHLGRMIQNDAALVMAFENLAKQEKDVVFNNANYNTMTLEEQIKTDLETDIMIGPHGAGLMHNIFMRDRAVLIELFIDGASANRHFHNLAHWYGRKYIDIQSPNPVKVDRIINTVKDVIKQMDRSKY